MTLNMRIGTRILAGYGLALLVVSGVGVVAYRATTELVDSADWVTHSHKVKEDLADVLSTMKDAETGQRGFLLTGEDSYLAPYNSGIKEVGLNIDRLRELTADNPNQQRRLAKLEPLVAAKLAELDETIRLRRESGERAALQVVLTDKGKSIMDDIRQIVGEMDEEENQLLKDRDQRSKATAAFARAAMTFGGALVLVLVALIAFLIQRSITRPLGAFMQFVGRVGEGDLTQRAKISTSDEIGESVNALTKWSWVSKMWPARRASPPKI